MSFDYDRFRSIINEFLEEFVYRVALFKILDEMFYIEIRRRNGLVKGVE